MASAWQVLALVTGTLLGVISLVMSGGSKLFPCHPFYPIFAKKFELSIGPFWGVPGSALRLLDSACHLAAGVGMLIGLYGELLSVIPDSLTDLASALMLCAPMGAAVELVVAAYTDCATGDDPKPAVVVCCIWLTCGFARLQVTPPAELLPWQLALVGCFAAACVLVCLVVVVRRFAAGADAAPLAKVIEEINGEAQAMMSGAKPATDAERSLVTG